MKLSELLLQKRTANKLGLRAVAAMCSVSFSTISRAERGLPISLRNFIRLCKWLDIDDVAISTMLMKEDDPSPAPKITSKTLITMFKSGHSISDLTINSGLTHLHIENVLRKALKSR